MLKTSKEYADTMHAIYDCLKQHIGEDQAISAQALCRLFDIPERELRSIIAAIRKSKDFEGVILSNNHGYFFGTAEEFDKAKSCSEIACATDMNDLTETLPALIDYYTKRSNSAVDQLETARSI